MRNIAEKNKLRLEKMSSIVRLTVIQLDLVKSSESTAVTEREIGPEGTNLLMQNIEQLVSDAFESVPNRSEYDEFQSLGGDGYRIVFKDVNHAYEFVKNFCHRVEKYNTNPHRKKRMFRIGAATGDVSYDKSKSGLNKIVGHDVLSIVSRLFTADPGFLYVDEETFKSLDEAKDFTQILVPGKQHEPKIKAWYRQMFSDVSLSTNEPIKVEEIYALFKQLTQQAQITRVAQFIEMPNDFRPSNYATLYDAKTAIVNWAEGYEKGEEYRLTRLNKLKDIILKLSVNS